MTHQSQDYNSNVSPRSTAFERGKFGRLFPSLPPQSGETPDFLALNTIASQMARDENNQDDSNLPAGYTYFGQFIAHDMSFDPTTIGERSIDPEYLWNFRTPALDLDSVYGGGPMLNPYLYDEDWKFLLDYKGIQESKLDLNLFDFQRNKKGVALIVDARNDENIILAKIHILFQLIHNYFVNKMKNDNLDPNLSKQAIFQEAKKMTTWHYQWIILYDYLPRIIGKKRVIDLLNFERSLSKERKYYNWRNEPFIPIEFAAAAFRFGHSQIRDIYTLGDGKIGKFKTPELTDDFVDLRQKNKLPTSIDLKTFFFESNSEEADQNFAHNIEPKIASSLTKVNEFSEPQDSHINRALEFLQLMLDTIELNGYDRLADGLIDDEETNIWSEILDAASEGQSDNLSKTLNNIRAKRQQSRAPSVPQMTNVEKGINSLLNQISGSIENLLHVTPSEEEKTTRTTHDHEININKIKEKINELREKISQLKGSFSPKFENLAVRTLLKGVKMSLPSGQSIAKLIGEPSLTIDFNGDNELNKKYGKNTPLWYYILAESKRSNEGENEAPPKPYHQRLGKVGATIIGEVIVGLIDGDDTSFLKQHSKFKPKLIPQKSQQDIKISPKSPIKDDEKQNFTMRTIIDMLECNSTLLP